MNGGSGQAETRTEHTVRTHTAAESADEGMADITVPDGVIGGQVNSLTRCCRAGVLSFLPFFNIETWVQHLPNFKR